MDAALRRYIQVAAIGAMDPAISEAICRAIQCLVGYDTRLVGQADDLGFAFDARRQQYCSTRILEKLAQEAPDGALKVVGLTRVDLFIPILTHVYGEAQLGGRSCVVSTYRLREGLRRDLPGPVYCERIAKEAIHELGHTFKLLHCPEPSCIMHYCRHIRDVDVKSYSLCRHCRVLLEDEKKRLLKRGGF
jgi:archaemetzincin